MNRQNNKHDREQSLLPLQVAPVARKPLGTRPEEMPAALAVAVAMRASGSATDAVRLDIQPADLCLKVGK